MKNIPILIFFLMCSPIFSADTDWNLWYRERTVDLELAMKLPEQERIPNLGELVRIGYSRSDGSHIEDIRLNIYSRAQSALLAIPGHAMYYEKRILRMSEEYKNLPEKIYSDPINRFLYEMKYGFETLAQLPSAETVKVLGEMLSDEWQASPGPVYGDRVFSSMAAHGALTLNELPLVDPPASSTNTLLTGKDRIADWQVWYAERKSGLKTFAFKGEPKEYRFKPDGTWDTIPISLPPGEVVSKAPISVTPKAVVIPPVQGQDRTWIWITSLSVLLLAVVGWLIRKKSRA